MVKIFFPACGVGFSVLYKFALTFCHYTVNKLIEQNQLHGSAFVLPKNLLPRIKNIRLTLLPHFLQFYLLFSAGATVVLTDEADRHLRVRGRIKCRKAY